MSLLKKRADEKYDVVVIGAGGAGSSGASYLAMRGLRVLVIERDSHFGGKCPKNACYLHHLFYDCAVELDFFRLFSGKLWWPEFNRKVPVIPVIDLFKSKRVITQEALQERAEGWGIEHVLQKEAKVIDANHVELNGRLISTKSILLATGAHAKVPPIQGVDLKGVFTYESLVEELDYEPNSVLVIGASKVGAPYASFFRACGCRTILADQRPFFPNLDGEVKRYVIGAMTERGIQAHEEVQIAEIIGKDRVESVRFKKNGHAWVADVDMVFIATGLIPNSEIVHHLNVDLGPMSEIIVNRKMETRVPGIYAAGDVIGPPMEQWKARKSGIVAAKNILGEHSEMRYDLYADQLHSTYEISYAGLSEERAREQFEHVKVLKTGAVGGEKKKGIVPMAERMMLLGHLYPEKTGFQKMVYDGVSGRILGLHHVGYGAKDSFSYLAYLLDKGITVQQMSEMSELFMDSSRFIQMARVASANTNAK